jgi:hypothetical protein
MSGGHKCPGRCSFVDWLLLAIAVAVTTCHLLDLLIVLDKMLHTAKEAAHN